MQQLAEGDLIETQYQVKKLISEGSFGKVYSGKDINTGLKIAIKVEKSEMSKHKSIQREITILKKLNGIPFITEMLWYGQYHGNQIVIQRMLGHDLIKYLRKLKQFSIDCIFVIAYQMIQILQSIHEKNIIHRDLKPENILGKNHLDKICLIDFGIAKDLDKITTEKQQKLPFIGTSRYASVAAHLGKEQTKKDDLESLGFVLIYLFKQQLPWMNLEKSDKIEKIGILKAELSLQQICDDCPPQLLQYMKLVRNIIIEPDYDSLKELFTPTQLNKLILKLDWFRPQKIIQDQRQSQNGSPLTKKRERSPSNRKNTLNNSPSPKHHKNTISFLNGELSPRKKITPLENEYQQRKSSSPKNKHFTILDDSPTHNKLQIRNDSPSWNSRDSGTSPSVYFSLNNNESIHVEFLPTNNSLMGSKLNNWSKYEENLSSDEFMSLNTQLQLMEIENHDLENKHNDLHIDSVLNNFKNPFSKNSKKQSLFKMNKC